MLNKEREFYNDQVRLIAGVDEAGRGPLAGPVCVASVVFPPEFSSDLIDDSKKLTHKKREELFDLIKKNALACAIVFKSAQEIDELNIYEATRLAMKEAVSQLNVDVDLVITDAMPLPNFKIKTIPMVKGDAQCLNVAAASILAKVTRDRYMCDLQQLYPNFSFSVHKGYGTKLHMEELNKFGPIEGVHRKSFKPVAAFYDLQLKLF